MHKTVNSYHKSSDNKKSFLNSGSLILSSNKCLLSHLLHSVHSGRYSKQRSHHQGLLKNTDIKLYIFTMFNMAFGSIQMLLYKQIWLTNTWVISNDHFGVRTLYIHSAILKHTRVLQKRLWKNWIKNSLFWWKTFLKSRCYSATR